LDSPEQRALREFWFLQRGEPLRKLLWGKVLALVNFDEAWGSAAEFSRYQSQYDIAKIVCNDRVALFDKVTCNGVEFLDVLEFWEADIGDLRVEVSARQAGRFDRDSMGLCCAALPPDILQLVRAGAWTHFCAGGHLHARHRRFICTHLAGKEASYSSSSSRSNSIVVEDL